MKFNVSYPITGLQKVLEIDDEKKIAIFFGKRMGNEVAGDELGEQFKGYIFKITGGNDKDGFSMKQGILVNGRVRLLMAKGSKTYRPRRKGERKRKSVRGSIVGPDIAVLALSISKTGDTPIQGLTDDKKPRRLGPKRANKIRKLFNLKKEDDVKRYVIRREIAKKEGKKVRTKAPKIQRLITDVRLRRKKIRKVECGKRRERTAKLKEDYAKLVTKVRAAKAHEAKHEETKAEPPKTKTATATTTQTATKGKTDPKATTKAPAKTQVPAPTTTKKDTKAPQQPAQTQKKTVEVPKKDDKKPAKQSKK